MAKKQSAPQPVASISSDRAHRLYRIVVLLGDKPYTRAKLTQQLGVGVRGFYRDLETLRQAGVGIDMVQGKYHLTTQVDKAVALVPFPDPGLSLGQAEQLAKGRTAAHKQLREQIEHIKREGTKRRSRK